MAENEQENQMRCNFCEHKCDLTKGRSFCGSYEEIGGQIQEIMYGITPDKLVKMAQKLGCHNIVFNVNEPAVSLQSLMRIKEYVGVKSIEPVLRDIKALAKTCHVETALTVIEDINDHELYDIANFIHEINPEIPWHVFRLLPEHNMKESIYLSLAISSNWSAGYCGLHDPSSADMDFINSLEHIERMVSKQEWIDLFKSDQLDLVIHQDIDLMPDYLLVSKQGYAFKTMGTTLRKPVNIPANNFKVPVYTPLGEVDDIRKIKNLILSNLESNKIALIIVEGVGLEHFPENSFVCEKGPEWFCNEPGDAFYLTLSTGRHEPFAYPAGYRYFDQDTGKYQVSFFRLYDKYSKRDTCFELSG